MDGRKRLKHLQNRDVARCTKEPIQKRTDFYKADTMTWGYGINPKDPSECHFLSLALLPE